MSRSVAALAAVPALLAGCGSDTGDGTAGPAPGPSSSSPSSPSSPSSTGKPSGPPLPAFGQDDYRYQLRVLCFCPYAGVPLTVAVRDGAVADVVYARTARGHRAGQPVRVEWLRLSIDDIIDRANDPKSDRVKVTWPQGQDYPSRVWVDAAANAVDDEVAYVIKDVRTSGAGPESP